MKITILVPVYGVEKYIAECAESLFQQTCREIEYIFCDDCTHDRSIEVLQGIIDKYPERKPHVKIVRNESNRGIGATRAHLLSEVNSDYFFFADSDDILPLNAIELLAKRMQETNVDIVDGAYQCCIGGKATSTIYPCHDSRDKFRRKVQAGNLVRHQLWGRLYRTEVIQRVSDLFVEGIDMAKDYCAMTRLVAVTTRAWTDDVVYLYRVEQQSFFNKEKNDRIIRSRLAATKKVLSFYHQRGHLPLALEIGILDAWRMCHKTDGPSVKTVDDALQYYPEHLTARLLLTMLRTIRMPYKITDLLYRTIRFIAVTI